MNHPSLKRFVGVILLACAAALIWREQPRSASPAPLPHAAAVPVPMRSKTAPATAPLAAKPPKGMATGVTGDGRDQPAAAAATASQRVTAAPARTVASPVLDAFRQWAEHYVAATEGEKPALVADGVRLAQARGGAMARLIHDDPQAAVAALLPYNLRQALPPEIASNIEYPVRDTGELLVLAVTPLPGQTVEEPIWRMVKIGEESYKTYTYGSRLQQISAKVTPILGVGVTSQDGQKLLALRDTPYEVLSQDEAAQLKAAGGQANTICPISGTPTTASADETALHIGSKIVWLASPALVNQWLQTPEGLILMEAGGSGSSGGTSTVTPATHTTGNKKFLAIRVRFANQASNYEPVSDAVLNSSLQTVVDKFRDWSYGKLQSTYAYTPTLDLPQADSWYYANGQENQLRTDALAAAAAYDDGSGNHPYASPETNFDFQAVVFTGSVSDGVYAGLGSVGGNSLWMRAPENPIIWLHEWGHNFGLGHANLWNVTSDSPIGPGVHAEYGNNHSVMGGNQSNYGPYNTFERYSIHWLESTDVVTATANGTCRIYNPDKTSLTTGHPYGMRVAKSGSLTYCIEFRPDWTPTADFTADNGALISWTQNDELLDMTPLSAAGQGDAALLIGRSFNDAAAKLTITPIARGGTSPDDYLDVVVNFTDPLSNSPPVAVVTASTYTPAVSGSVTLTAIASDPDGDTLAYSWDFGDGGNPSVNNSATQTKSWSTAGDYNVRCTVSDMKGKTAVQNLVIHVGTPATFSISGRVTTSDGTPVPDVLIQDANWHITYTDSDGRYTLGALAANTYSLSALHDGWTFVAQFANPVVIGPSVVNLDFTATGGSSTTPPTMPNTVTVAATDASASEAGPDTGTFTITRTGPTTAALPVYFDLTGAATYGLDYQPTGLSATIPAGSASTTVTITPISDSLAEPDETVILTLSPAVTYTLGATTSGTVIIHDSGPTQVSIVATDPAASNTSGDTGTFTVTRTGSTAGALTVNLTIGGSATNGTDYMTLPTTVTIPASQSSTTITVSPNNPSGAIIEEDVILTIASGTGYTVGSPATATVRILPQPGTGGGILREWYDFTSYYYGGGAIGDLIGCPRYPFTTSGSEIVTDVFEAPQSNPNTDYFGERWRAWFTAPVTGNYIFYIASDDASELWLSTDATPERKSRICYATTGTGFRNWTAQGSQASATIALTAGQRYYVEALFKDYTGSDDMSVGVQYPNGALERPIPAYRFDPYTPATPLPAAWTGTDIGAGTHGSAGVAADFIPAAPKHRYSFSGTANAAIADGTAVPDSIGGASAAVRGAGAVFNSSGAGIDLPGGSSTTQAYIDLPSGVITGTYGGGTRYTSATYEAWVTMNTTQSWARIFDFGTSSIGEVNAPGGTFNGTDTHHVALSSNNGPTPYDQRLSRNYPAGATDVYSDAHSIDSSGAAANAIQYHVVLVYDAVAQNWRWYRNGLLMQTLPDTQGLTTINDVNNWLGRSMVSTDSNLDGVFDEFRIYDYALTEAQIRGNKNAGANKVNNVSDGTFGPVNISGGGALSTSGTADAFHFESQPITGDYTVQVKLLSITENSTTARAGLMLRTGTAANAPHAFIGLSSAGTASFIKRTTAGAAASKVDVTGLVFPQWLRLVRSGNTIAAYVSTDGTTWTQQGTTTTYASLPASLQVGLAVSSGSTTRSALAQFDEFKATATVISPTVTVTPTGTATKTSPITFTLTFSETVTGLTAAKVTVTNGTKGALSGSGTTYTLPVTPTAQGAVTCQVPAAAAQSATSVNNTASNIASVSYDTVAPTVTVTPPGTATGASPIPFTLTFSESVSGLTTADITVTNGAVSSLTGSGTTYTASVTPSAQGTVTCRVIASAAQDAAGNTSTASNTASVIYDSVPPTVTVTPSGVATGASPIPFALTFSKPVSGLTTADIIVTNGTVSSLTGSGPAYTASVTPSAQGTVTCQVAAAAAQDTAGNNNAASNTASVSYDTVGPTLTIGAPSAASTVSGPVTYTVTYADANFNASTLNTGNLTLNRTGSANVGTVTVTGTGATRTVTISSITGDGTLGISIAAGTAIDTPGNPAAAAGPSAPFLVSSLGPVIKAATGTDLTAGASWTSGTAPTSGRVAAWASTSLGGNLTLANSGAWGGINVTGATAAITISGAGTLTLDAGGMDLSTSTVNLTISNPLALSANQIWNVNTAKTLTVSGTISGTGFGLIKSGSGTLTLSGSAAAAFGAGAITLGDTTGNNNANLNLNGGVTYNAYPISVASTNTGLSTITTAQNLTFPGAITLNSHDLTVGSSGNTGNLTGGISGTGNVMIASTGSGIFNLSTGSVNPVGSITNSSTGTGATTISAPIGNNVTSVTQNSATSKLTLSGTNTFSGGLSIKAGTVYVSANNNLSSGTITLGDTSGTANATLQTASSITPANAIVVAAGSSGTLQISESGNNQTTWGGPIALNNHLTVGYSNSGKTTTFTGLVTLDSVAHTISNVNASGTVFFNGGFVIGSGGLTLATGNTYGITVQTGSVAGTGPLTLNNNGSTNNAITISSGINTAGTITNSGTGAGTTTISGVIGANVTSVVQNSSSSTLILSGSNTYTGPTTVNSGTLSITNAFLASTSTVNLNTGGALNLNFTGTNTVSTLRINGLDQSPGMWGGLASSATYKTALITGTGILNVTNGPAQQPYASWVAAYNLESAPGQQSHFGDDPDNDGIPNGLEWIFGGNPLANNTSILPHITGDANNLVFTFARNVASKSTTTLIAEWSNNLIGWTAVPISPTSSGPDANGVTVTITANGSAADTVVVTIPRSNAVAGKLFVRLKATSQ